MPLEADRSERLLGRYLGPDREERDLQFRGPDPDRWRFVRSGPEIAVARDRSFDPSLG